MKTIKSKQRHAVSRKQSKSSLPRLFTAEDALKPPPPLQWCVQDLFPRPSLNMLVGGPGSKKTLLAIDLAVCVALGKPWLRRPVSQCAVLYLDEQSGPLQFWNRLNSAFAAHAVPSGTPLVYSSMSGLNLRDRQEVDALIERCLQLDVHLIIFDSFTNFLRGGASSFSGLYPALSNLRRIAEKCNAAVLSTHHTNHRGVLHGSLSISAAFDLLLSIKSDPDSSLLEINSLKSRFLPPPKFFARANFEIELSASKVSLNYAKDPALKTYWWQRMPYSSDSTEYRILHQLEMQKPRPMTFYEIRMDNAWRGPRKVRNAIQALMDSNLIARGNEGKQGKEAEYVLVKPLDEVWPEEDA